ncbi:MAG: DHH family phosphoesterase [Eubacteriales bacterium]|nr:DHH family phosphoesterase [Eubacteriales bacterium]MDD4630344.1 DHH family phosphoesterase [Eubacteriales bacterium]
MGDKSILSRISTYLNNASGKKNESMKAYKEHIFQSVDKIMDYSNANHPLPLCMIDSEGMFLWYNNKFADIYHETDIVNLGITRVTGLKASDFFTEDPVEKPVMVTQNGRTYKVVSSFLGEDKNNSAVLYWIDMTNYELVKTLYKDEKNCYAYVIVDNYDELISSSPDDRKSIVAAEIERTVRQWAGKMSASVTRYRNSQYFIVFEFKHFEKQEAGKFSILDEVREIETDADFPVSLSIGIGVGGKTPQQGDEYAAAALDLALGRGGDQAVVKKVSKIEYYGGRLQTVEKRNKGKSRIMAHALRQLIDQSDQVIIMGHKKPDMDSFGASIGVSRIARNRNKPVFVIINSYNESLSEMYNIAVESGNYNFIDNEEAIKIADKDTLLIVLDTHRTNFVECPELLSMTDKLVIIDHHRKTEEFIENATLTYMEAYASSTSELITEILQYSGDKKDIDKFEAEVLLAGITIDTNRFAIKTGVRTFDAASWLRRMGADTANVRQFFQTDINTLKLRSQIVSNAFIPLPGIAITKCEGRHLDVQVINSIAADEMLNIKGIKASFAVGENEQGYTVISARSLGEINVQMIMEKLGGGGNLTKAGAQPDITMDEAVELIINQVKELEKK